MRTEFMNARLSAWRFISPQICFNFLLECHFMPSDEEVLKCLAFSVRPILLYGAGNFGGQTLSLMESLGIQVLGFLDSDANRHNTTHIGKPIFPFDTNDINIRECNIVLTMLGGQHLGLTSFLEKLGVPLSQVFTNCLAWYQPPAFEITNIPDLDRHLNLYSLSRHLVDTESARLFKLRYRHMVLGDSPQNPPSPTHVDCHDGIVAWHSSAHQPVFYPNSGALWWDLLHRWQELCNNELRVEFDNSDSFFWRIPFFLLNVDPGYCFVLRPGSTTGRTRFCTCPGSSA